jgi:hypothetical protein
MLIGDSSFRRPENDMPVLSSNPTVLTTWTSDSLGIYKQTVQSQASLPTLLYHRHPPPLMHSLLTGSYLFDSDALVSDKLWGAILPPHLLYTLDIHLVA